MKSITLPMGVQSAQYDCGLADYIDAPAKMVKTGKTYAIKPSPSVNGVPPVNWVIEKPWGNGSNYPESFPRLRKINGVVRGEHLKGQRGTSLLGPATDQNKNFPSCGGEIGVSNPTPYATVRGHPGPGPLFLELDGYGGILAYNRDGTITPMGGVVVLDPYVIPDEKLTGWKTTVGIFPSGPLKEPHDFCFDFIDRKAFYIADTGNNRIVKVSRHDGVVAGQPEDFTKWKFAAWGELFVRPTSIDSTPSGTIYVVDSIGLWTVDRNTGVKSLLLSMKNLFWVRVLSDGTPCMTDTLGNIFKFDLVTKIAAPRWAFTYNGNLFPSHWPVISVDQAGVIGPVDSIYGCMAANYLTWRFDQAGAREGIGPTYFRGNNGRAAMGGSTYVTDHAAIHYVWNLEVHQMESYVFARGYGNSLPSLIRPMLSSEMIKMHSYDFTLATIGNEIMKRGTIEGFPWGARPSLTALFSSHGQTGLGIKDFTDIQAMPLQERIDYVTNGMGGVVKRPELTGLHLRALLYWIWRNSKQYMDGVLFEWPAAPASTTKVIIQDIFAERVNKMATWAFATDVPALCYVRFGPVELFRFTNMEMEFSNTHAALANFVDYPQVAYQVVALGKNGQLTENPIAVL